MLCRDHKAMVNCSPYSIQHFVQLCCQFVYQYFCWTRWKYGALCSCNKFVCHFKLLFWLLGQLLSTSLQLFSFLVILIFTCSILFFMVCSKILLMFKYHRFLQLLAQVLKCLNDFNIYMAKVIQFCLYNFTSQTTCNLFFYETILQYQQGFIWCFICCQASVGKQTCSQKPRTDQNHDGCYKISSFLHYFEVFSVSIES